MASLPDCAVLFCLFSFFLLWLSMIDGFSTRPNPNWDWDRFIFFFRDNRYLPGTMAERITSRLRSTNERPVRNGVSIPAKKYPIVHDIVEEWCGVRSSRSSRCQRKSLGCRSRSSGRSRQTIRWRTRWFRFEISKRWTTGKTAVIFWTIVDHQKDFVSSQLFQTTNDHSHSMIIHLAIQISTGSTFEETTQYGRIGKKRNVGFNSFDRQFGLLDVDRIVAIRFHSRFSSHRLERLIHCRGRLQMENTSLMVIQSSEEMIPFVNVVSDQSIKTSQHLKRSSLLARLDFDWLRTWFRKSTTSLPLSFFEVNRCCMGGCINFSKRCNDFCRTC